MERKVTQVQQLVVKQNFELANSKKFYQSEVQLIQQEMQDMKLNFT